MKKKLKPDSNLTQIQANSQEVILFFQSSFFFFFFFF